MDWGREGDDNERNETRSWSLGHLRSLSRVVYYRMNARLDDSSGCHIRLGDARHACMHALTPRKAGYVPSSIPGPASKKKLPAWPEWAHLARGRLRPHWTRLVQHNSTPSTGRFLLPPASSHRRLADSTARAPPWTTSSISPLMLPRRVRMAVVRRRARPRRCRHPQVGRPRRFFMARQLPWRQEQTTTSPLRARP